MYEVKYFSIGSVQTSTTDVNFDLSKDFSSDNVLSTTCGSPEYDRHLLKPPGHHRMVPPCPDGVPSQQHHKLPSAVKHKSQPSSLLAVPCTITTYTTQISDHCDLHLHVNNHHLHQTRVVITSKP